MNDAFFLFVESGTRANRFPMMNTSFEMLYQRMPQASMVLDTNLAFIAANEAYCRAVERSRDELIGRYIFDAFPDTPERLEPVLDVFKRTLSGDVTRLERQPYKLHMADGRIMDRLWDIEQFPIYSETGAVEYLVQYCEDVTEREALRVQRDLVSAELNHRVRNTLAVVQSVAEHTSLTAQDYDSFLKSFQGRLSAISRNFAALSESHWQGLDLESVISAELEPYAGPVLDRITIDGPPLTLSVKATKDTSMLVHELTTNASKYGFLTQPEGRLSISWRVEDGVLQVNWHETGMTGISVPDRSGFGFQLFDLMPNITVERVFEPDGLKLKAEIPFDIVSNELVFGRS